MNGFNQHEMSADQLAGLVAAYNRNDDRTFVLGVTAAEVGEEDFELAWQMRQALERDVNGEAFELLFNAPVKVTPE